LLLSFWHFVWFAHFNKSVSGILYDVNGRNICSFRDTNYLDIFALSSEVYFIKTDYGVEKLIKQ